MKAGLTSHRMGRSAGTSGSSNKIIVPIPVHVNRFAIRSQHQHMEKMALSGPKAILAKSQTGEAGQFGGFERFSVLPYQLKIE